MGTVWTNIVNYLYPQNPIIYEMKELEYICAGCGSRIPTYIVRELNDNCNRYYCSIRCYQKPKEKQAILY